MDWPPNASRLDADWRSVCSGLIAWDITMLFVKYINHVDYRKREPESLYECQ
jgi:hypothetical protein